MRPLSSPRVLLSLSSSLLLSTAAAAQVPVYANSVAAGMEASPYPSLPFGGGGNFEKVQVLDLDGDGAKDALTLDAGHVVFMYRPEDFKAHYELQRPSNGGDLIVNDFALLDEASDTVYGGYGTIVTVGPAGLETYVWDDTAEDFVRDFATAGDWVDAVQVELGDFDADGDLDIYALDVTGDEVHVMLNDGAYGWTTRASIPLAVGIYHFQLLNWQANARPEIAGTNSTSLRVFNSAGSVQATFTSLRPTDMMVGVQTASSYDEIAWVEGPFISGPEYTLSIYTSSGLASSTALPANEVPITLAGGTYGTDSAEDLGLTFMSNYDVLVVDYDGADIALSPTTTTTPTPSASYGGHNQAPVAFEDMDWDGKPDVLLASTPAHALMILHQETQGGTDPLGGQPNTGDAFDPGWNSICVTTPPVGPPSEDPQGYYEAKVGVHTIPGGADAWEITVWRQSSNSAYTDQASLKTCDVDSGDITGNQIVIKTNLPFEAIEYTDPSTNPNTTVFHIMLTPVDANDNVVGRSYIGTYARMMGGLGASQSYIELADDWTDSETVDMDPCTGGPGDAVRAGHQGSKGLPPMPPGLIPRKLDQCETLDVT